jgi:hypothetical protein
MEFKTTKPEAITAIRLNNLMGEVLAKMILSALRKIKANGGANCFACLVYHEWVYHQPKDNQNWYLLRLGKLRKHAFQNC